MKRYTLLLMAVTGFAVLLGCKQPNVAEDRPEPPPPATEVPVPSAMPPGDESIVPTPVRTILDSEVGSRWKAVEITVTEKSEGGKSFTVEIPLGGETDVEGTPLKVKLLGFVPDFAMGADSITTKSLDDVNPAAKIEVSEGEQVLFTGWSFRDFPEMHSFDDPRYTVQLSKAIPNE